MQESSEKVFPNLKFTHENKDFELIIKQIDSKIILTLLLSDNDELYWENAFSEKDLIENNCKWRNFEFNEILPFIFDMVTRKNCKIEFNYEQADLIIWTQLIMGGQKEKKLNYTLNLIAKKFDRDSLVQKLLGNLKKMKKDIEEIKTNMLINQEKIGKIDEIKKIKKKYREYNLQFNEKIDKNELKTAKMFEDVKTMFEEKDDKMNKMFEELKETRSLMNLPNILKRNKK